MTPPVVTNPRPRGEGGPFPIDWGQLGPLRVRAKAVADGVYAGAHPSVRRGAGVEFGGYRAYSPGDDLRQLDRRALLRHNRLLLRQFETETDRAVWLLVDATASMSLRGERSPGDKLAYASLLAAAMARIAVASGDPVGLAWLGGENVRPLPATAGREAFLRVTAALEGARAFGDPRSDASLFDDALALIARRARRGAVVILLSDLLDLPERALPAFMALAGGGRVLAAVQVLDELERDFSFSGSVRLRALEGDGVVEADAELVRKAYQSRLHELTMGWREGLVARGSRLVQTVTSDDPVETLRDLLRAIGGSQR